MDSGLLNVFHEDSFDGSYLSYTNDNDMWTHNETLGIQLTDTLNGILPIAPNENATDIYDAAIVRDDYDIPDRRSFTFENLMVTQKTDTNFVTENGILDMENKSVDSDYTFRTRSDSSSIADYESHSSDYDDDVDDDDDDDADDDGVVEELINSNSTALLETDEFNFDMSLVMPNLCSKKRTLSSTTIGSDVDGLQFMGNNFDLAEFITKDDFKIHTPDAEQQLDEQKEILHIHSNTVDSDSESDIIVDVETVEIEENEKAQLPQSLVTENYEFSNQDQEQLDDITYIDNVNGDPSWSPKVKKKTEPPNKLIKSPIKTQQIIRNVTTPNKRQCSLLKGIASKCNKSGLSADKQKIKRIKTNEAIANHSQSNTNMIHIGGKNLALLKLDLANKDLEQPTQLPTIENEALQIEERKINEEDDVIETKIIKRKLNLEEYKKRRCGESSNLNTQNASIQINVNTNTKANQIVQVPNRLKMTNVSPIQHSEAVTTVVKSLREQIQQSQPTDPITIAKNKVLRMQQLKRAKQIKIIDSTVSSKVARVTKLLPLREIVKDTYCAQNNDENHEEIVSSSSKQNSDYEEIRIISVGCNTEISMPPNLSNKNVSNIIINPSRRSLLKSTVLLQNISNTFQKMQSNDNLKLSTNSLIASIQNVVVNKTMSTIKSNIEEKSTLNNSEQHGEDMIIMHLHKDRIRTRTMSIAIQTELQAEFPLLPLLKVRHDPKQRNYRMNCKTKETITDESDTNCHEFTPTSLEERSRSRSHEAEHSCASSVEHGRRNYETTGGYSSQSSRHHRSSVSSSYSESDRNMRGRRQRKTSYTHKRNNSRAQSTDSSDSDYSNCRRSRSRSRSKSRNRRKNDYTDRNVSHHAVEERRIVYVGRIEEETTKDMLRRKFLPYGSIKRITMHYKETGMIYGFVTYERAEDAFVVIDKCMRDPQISMYDISFGGRRAFCRASYADLDNAGINNYNSYVFPKAKEQPKEDDSFEALLQKMKQKLVANKTISTNKSDKIDETQT